MPHTPVSLQKPAERYVLGVLTSNVKSHFTLGVDQSSLGGRLHCVQIAPEMHLGLWYPDSSIGGETKSAMSSLSQAKVLHLTGPARTVGGG